MMAFLISIIAFLIVIIVAFISQVKTTFRRGYDEGYFRGKQTAINKRLYLKEWKTPENYTGIWK